MKNILSGLQRWYAMIASLSIFLGGCTAVIVRSLFGKETREKTNTSLRERGKKILRLMRAHYKITYPDNFHYLENLPRIYMSNHLSLFDTPLFYATIPDTIRIVTKKELTKVPLMGKAILKAENVIIDRKIPAHSQNFYQDARHKLNDGIALWIFPEGTRSINGELLPFKLGSFRFAYETGAQIIPVGIVGTNKILRAKKALPYLNQNIELRLGQPIDTRSYSNPELQKQLMDEVFAQIKQLSSD